MVWKSKQPKSTTVQPVDDLVATMRSEWNFDDTIRGTIKGAPVSLDMEEFEVPIDWASVQVEVGEGTVRPTRAEEPASEPVPEPEPEPEPVPVMPVTERGQAGRAMVDDILLPAMQKVSNVMALLMTARDISQRGRHYEWLFQAGQTRSRGGVQTGRGHFGRHQTASRPLITLTPGMKRCIVECAT